MDASLLTVPAAFVLFYGGAGFNDATTGADMTESSAICQYLADTYGATSNWPDCAIQPATRRHRGAMGSLLEARSATLRGGHL